MFLFTFTSPDILLEAKALAFTSAPGDAISIPALLELFLLFNNNELSLTSTLLLLFAVCVALLSTFWLVDELITALGTLPTFILVELFKFVLFSFYLDKTIFSWR